MLRYSCQMALPGFGEAAQEKLRRSKVLIIGAGGLGCPAAQYLASSGVGTLGIADYDKVSESNLHRQILYTPGDIGLMKAVVACERLQKQNPEITLKAITDKIASDNITPIISGYDILVDCTDNFETRYLINDAAVLSGKPVVYGAIYQYEGQVAVWNNLNNDGSRSSNYRDLYPQINASQIPSCADGGVIPVLAGIIGCMQAGEAIKWITQTGELLAGHLLMFDAQTMRSSIIKLRTVSKYKITKLTPGAIVATINAAELQEKLLNENYQLVDVRTDHERDQFDIGGVHIEANEIEDHLTEFKPEKNYIFYCSSGKRSAEAVKLLSQKRPDIKAFSLENGLKSWMELITK